MRYENWLFCATVSLFLVIMGTKQWQQGRFSHRTGFHLAGALMIANLFPAVQMTTSYVVLGRWVPAMGRTDSFADSNAVENINLLLLALSSFPLEIVMVIAGVVLTLNAERNEHPRVYLLFPALTALLFALAFKGQLPVHGADPARILLPYLVLMLPYAGVAFTRLVHAPSVNRSPYAIVTGCLLLTAIGTFDVIRVFNYPATGFDREAFYVGQTLRALQDVGDLSEAGGILVEKGKQGWVPFDILALTNRPERFARFDGGDIASVCEQELLTDACRISLQQEGIHLVILTSPRRIQSFQQTFRGRSWQVGAYHIFELEGTAVYRGKGGFNLTWLR